MYIICIYNIYIIYIICIYNIYIIYIYINTIYCIYIYIYISICNTFMCIYTYPVKNTVALRPVRSDTAVTGEVTLRGARFGVRAVEHGDEKSLETDQYRNG